MDRVESREAGNEGIEVDGLGRRTKDRKMKNWKVGNWRKRKQWNHHEEGWAKIGRPD